ncbi:MAG: alpha/beta fold hydrolase [Anaerolineae bacterium]|nr:alpha/beta fold hydrolase [Anaerolineae bacterium]
MSRLMPKGVKHVMIRVLCVIFLFGVLLAGCGNPSNAAKEDDGAAGLTPVSTLIVAPTSMPTPSVAPTTVPTATFTPDPTPTATPTDTPTPIPTHPLMIDVMREQIYPGSELVIEEILAPGSNYDRTIVSYLSEGLKIYALLTVPRGEKPETGWPVVIFNHGYIPPDQYRTTERYVAYTDAFSRNGYILLRSDYRGHGSSEGEATSSYASPAYTVDVLNGMSSVMRHPDADPNRVGMWGHSMGGSIALRAMVVTDTIKSGVIWAGVTAPYPVTIDRWVRRWANNPTPTPDPEDTADDWDDELWRLDVIEENRVFWDAIDPFTYLDDISGPVQIHHGTADESVPVDYSEILHASLVAAGQASELYIYEGDNHNISSNFGTAAQRSVEFFDAHLKGIDE